MSNKEILEKAIQKAIDGGWDSFGTETHQIDVEEVDWLDGELQPTSIDVDKPGLYVCLHRPHMTFSVPELIFNHDFAKALWGEGQYKVTARYFGKPYGKMSWEYHLQMMVIADDPIRYLGENI